MKTNGFRTLVFGWLPAAMLLAVLGGCAAAPVRMVERNARMDVFGIELYSAVDYREIKGVVATEEPCLKGYERVFDNLEISIGYGRNRRIRKITTRNPGTSMFGIRPGDAFPAARDQALREGFKEADQPHRFRNDWCSLVLLVDQKGMVFGLTVELLD